MLGVFYRLLVNIHINTSGSRNPQPVYFLSDSSPCFYASLPFKDKPVVAPHTFLSVLQSPPQSYLQPLLVRRSGILQLSTSRIRLAHTAINSKPCIRCPNLIEPFSASLLPPRYLIITPVPPQTPQATFQYFPISIVFFNQRLKSQPLRSIMIVMEQIHLAKMCADLSAIDAAVRTSFYRYLH